ADTATVPSGSRLQARSRRCWVCKVSPDGAGRDRPDLVCKFGAVMLRQVTILTHEPAQTTDHHPRLQPNPGHCKIRCNLNPETATFNRTGQRHPPSETRPKANPTSPHVGTRGR